MFIEIIGKFIVALGYSFSKHWTRFWVGAFTLRCLILISAIKIHTKRVTIVGIIMRILLVILEKIREDVTTTQRVAKVIMKLT